MSTAAPYVVDAGYEAFSGRGELRGHLAREAFLALARRSGETFLFDGTKENDTQKFSAGKFLAVAIVLAARWKKRYAGQRRVGVILPPGMGGFVANLALMLAGKVPVNLNVTMGRRAALACMEKAGLTTMISAAPVQKRVAQRFPDFPWPEDTLDLLREVQKMDKLGVVFWMLAIKLCPPGWLADRLELPAEGGEAEAAILFTSGSVGLPKGVVLSHRNILANCAQIRESGFLPGGRLLLANLPLFHSFGLTVTLWYGLIGGLRVATIPSPLEVARTASFIAETGAEVLVSTPTFFRPYFTKAKPEQLKSVKYVVAGAEKTPKGFGERWEETFGSRYFEGYGLTETSPVVSCNLPASGLHRRGTIGKLFAGQRARVVDAESREPLSKGETGILELQGANVFGGYLEDEEKTSAAFHEGWFVTGDLARFDEDDLIVIEGRLTRFSKLGGEMVPHGTIEQALLEVYELTESESLPLAVTGVQDEQKGESLVVLTTFDIDPGDMRKRLAEHGLPNLWIPRIVRKVGELPVLGSGKLDLRALRTLASEKN